MTNPDKLFGRLGNRMFQMAYIYAQVRRGDIPDLYLQSEKYFESHRDEIRELFGEGIGRIDLVGIHVRRGGNPSNPNEPKYCENPFYIDLMKTPYYNNAIAMFPKENFLVFSDDIPFCKEKWGMYPNFQFAEGNEIEDLNALASCKAVIMANSSFSWWAAYLSNGTVVAPREWYGDGKIRTKLLDKWIKI